MKFCADCASYAVARTDRIMVQALMCPKLLSQEELQIPEALTLDHEDWRAELIRVASQPGRIGRAAADVALS